jgi:uncharacterized protein (UPF0216 family)
MPQRTANMALTLHREGKRIKIAAGQTYNFTADELEQLKAIDANAVRKPVVETDGSENVKASTKPEVDEKEVVDTKASGKPLTAAEKKKQAAAQAAQEKADENGESGSGNDDL